MLYQYYYINNYYKHYFEHYLKLNLTDFLLFSFVQADFLRSI